MRGYRKVAVAAAILLVAATTGLAQESALKYFSADTFVLLEIDFNGLMKVIPADMMEEMKQKMMKDIGVDLTGKVDSFVMGIPAGMMSGDPSNMYGILKGNMTVDMLLAALKAAGKEVKPVQIGSLTAYTMPEEEAEEASYFAAAGPGLIVFGMHDGLETFQKIAAGQEANASTNAALSSAMNDAGTKGFLRLGGVFPEDMKAMMSAQIPGGASLSTFAVNADYANDFLALRSVLGADDATVLQQMKMMMESQMEMVKQMDSTGAMTELVDNMKIDISGNKMIITTGLSKAAIEKLIDQFGAMFGMFAQ